MIIVEFEIKGRKNQKKFESTKKAIEFLSKKGFSYDYVNDYYWKLNVVFGWVMKAKINE